MIAWLFWPSLVVLVYFGGWWMLATFCPEGTRTALRLGEWRRPDDAGRWREPPDEPPEFLLRLRYPEDGC